MPKTNDNTGATYAGNQGIVEHGAPIEGGRVLSELDPELNLDGTLIEGEHPDHPKGEQREHVSPSDPEPQPVDAPADEDDAKRDGKQESTTADKPNEDRSGAPVYGKGATTPARGKIPTRTCRQSSTASAGCLPMTS